MLSIIRVGVISAAALVASGACGSDDSTTTKSEPTAASVTTETNATTTSASPVDQTDAPDQPSTSAPPKISALLMQNGVAKIDWSAVSDPFYAPARADEADPYYSIHTRPRDDGFYFALEMYTTGYGALWTGETGATELGCAESPPGANSTGICVQFDPDGPGPLPPLDGFTATGTLTINRLDETGYDIEMGRITFADGTTIEPFRLRG